MNPQLQGNQTAIRKKKKHNIQDIKLNDLNLPSLGFTLSFAGHVYVKGTYFAVS